MSAGSIVIDLLMKTGAFETDTKRAEQSLAGFQKAAQGVGSALGLNARIFDAFTTSLKAVGAGLVVGLTFDKIKEKISGAIEVTAGLQVLSERTGATVEGLSALSGVAKLSGTGTDELATGLQRLGKSMIEAQDQSSKAALAFKAIGVSVADLKGLKPDEAFVLIANRLGTYADGAGKTALAQQLLGKSGANLLPVIANLAALGVYQVKVTKEQAQAAEDYERNINRLNAAQSVVFKVIATEMTPVLDAFVKTMLELATATDSVGGATKALAADGSIQKWAESAAEVVGFVVDAFDGVGRAVRLAGIFLAGTAAEVDVAWHSSLSNIGENMKDLREQVKKDMAAILDAPLFSDRLKRQLAKLHDDANYSHEGRNSRRPEVPLRPSGEAAEAEAILRKQLDGQIKLIKEFATQQRDAVAFVNKLVEGQYQAGETSLSAFLDDQQKLRAYALRSQLDEQDKIIAAEQAYASKATKPSDRVDAEYKIKEAVQAKKNATIKAAQEEQIALQASARDVRQLHEQYDALRATLLQIGGDAAGAARVGIDKQVQDAQRLINQAASLPPVKRLAEGDQAQALRAGLEGQIAVSEVQRKYNLLLDRQRDAEESIALAATKSGASELDTLQAVGSSRAAALKQLDDMVEKATQLALSFPTSENIRFAEQLALQFKKASAEIDPLAQKINSTLEDSFSNAFSGFIAGTKSASDAFRDFARNVINEIANIAAKNLAKSLFGDKGGSTGAGGFFSAALAAFSGFFGGDSLVDTSGAGNPGGINGGAVLPDVLRGGAAGGSNLIERDMITLLHKGEAVVPKEFNPFADGRRAAPSDGGSRTPNVIIENHGARIEQQPQGNGDLRLIINAAVAEAAAGLANGTGPMAKAAKARGIRLDGALPTRA